MKPPSRLQILYTHLVANRRAHVDGWNLNYQHFTKQIQIIGDGLIKGRNLQDLELYEGTEFQGANNPFQDFAKRLIYDKNNGIASRGQSVLSWSDFEQFVREPGLVSALEELLKSPNQATVRQLEAQWEKLSEKTGGRRTPLLINRTIAACTLDVSSTVKIGDFENVFWWLIHEGLIPVYDGDQQDWYSKNVHLMGHLHDQFADQLALPEDTPGHTSKTLLSIFVWELSQNIANPFSLRKQIVKYGAPGTGKTYQAKESTSLLFAIWQEKFGHLFPEVSHASNIEVVQFHPSYGYEDFIEGLRPQAAEGGDWQLKLQNGIFKEFCRRAGKWEVDVHQIPDHGPKMAQNWEELKVKDIRPFLGQQLSGESWQGFEDLEGEVKLVDLIPPYFFIIDEINRAELSRVLGELMMCLEYRGVKGAITTQYAALNSAENGMLKTTVGARFFIPHNVYLIGTMNTIDRSVESFDLALRRRFRWEPVDPDPQIARYYLKSLKGKNWDELADDLVKLNKKIRENELLGADYQIGHAYLMNLRYRDSLSLKEVREKIWEDSIAPLLEEYLRGTGRAEELIPEFIKAFGL